MIFKVVHRSLYDKIIVDICYYKFVQTHRMYDTKSKT